jgi:hypothetical protein
VASICPAVKEGDFIFCFVLWLGYDGNNAFLLSVGKRATIRPNLTPVISFAVDGIMAE